MPTWSEETAGDNRHFAPSQRSDHFLIYRDSGPADRDTAVLLVHGLGGSKAVWRQTVDALRANHRVISLDLLGHGNSGKPVGCDYEMATQAGVVRELLDSLQLKQVDVIGASYGGGVALELARGYCENGPQTGAATVAGADSDLTSGAAATRPAQSCELRSLILIDAAAYDFPPPPTIHLARNRALRWWVMNVTTSQDMAGILLRRAFWRRERITPDIRAEYARGFDDKATRRAVADGARNMFTELARRKSEPRRYAAIRCPMLILWGDHDRTVPIAVMHELADRFPAAKTHVFEDCGHSPIEEMPDKSIPVLVEFLSRRP